MFTIDGVPVRSQPITIATLYCGCVTFYDGHDIAVDRVVLCREPDVHPFPDQQNGLTAIQRVAHTHLVS